MKKISAIGAIAAAVLATGMLASCSSASLPQPPVPSGSTAPAPSQSGDTAQPPAGEIWQWALGRNVWDDPALQPYTHELGLTSDTDVNVQSKGFQLTADPSGTVYSVTVYNDETALGLPGVETNFSAYSGALPLGLTWSDTADDVVSRYGTGNQAGGYGTPITFTYLTQDGYRVEVGLFASHEADLAGAPIHYIRVSRA